VSELKVRPKKIIGFSGRPSSLGGPGSFQERVTKVFVSQGMLVVYPEDDIIPDVILLIGGTRKIFWLYKCKNKGTKIIHRLDGINWRHIHYNFFSKRRLISLYRNFNVSFIRRYLSNYVVYQSDFVKNWWESEYGDLQKPDSVIHNGVNFDKFYANDKNMEEIELLIVEGNIEDDRVTRHIVLNLCNFLINSGILNKISIVGNVPFSLNEEIKEIKGINLTGVVSRDNVKSFYRRKSILLSLDLDAACPNTVIEAMAAGIPVVGYDTGALKELVSKESGILKRYDGDVRSLDLPSVDVLAQSIKDIMLSYSKYSSGARKNAVDRFDISKVSNSYLDILSKF
jgi:glycosyltransferase involved in cell wall biosynthesis